jgi:hypothetical protein
MTEDRLVPGVSTDGLPVAECELAASDLGELPALIEEARRSGARWLWVHSSADLAGAGFAPVDGYRKFSVGSCPAGDPLPVLDAGTVAGLWPRAFAGQWGHKHVDAVTARTVADSPGVAFLGLRTGSEWTGLCQVVPAERLIDGPGFIRDARSGDAVRRLVLGACAYLGPGPATVETWGESAVPYLALGFELTEETGGWELDLAQVPSGP